MRRAAVVALVAATACAGRPAAPQATPASPTVPSPLPTPLDQIDVREGMESRISEFLGSRGLRGAAGRTSVELEDVDDYGPVVLIRFGRFRGGRVVSYIEAIAQATSDYAEDLERLGYGYVAMQGTITRVFAKVGEWKALNDGDLSLDEFNDRWNEECCFLP